MYFERVLSVEFCLHRKYLDIVNILYSTTTTTPIVHVYVEIYFYKLHKVLEAYAILINDGVFDGAFRLVTPPNGYVYALRSSFCHVVLH